jgi:transcriptional regulator with XRE-family HTH domain
MQSVGKLIRATRLEAGLSLEEISAYTRISVRNLQAIEEDDVSVMPSAFFYKSFVNQFGNALGIQSQTLTPMVDQVLPRIPEPLVPGQAERIAKGAVIRSSTRPRNYKWLFSVGSLALALVCCSGFYAFWEKATGNANRVVAKAERKPVQAPPVGLAPLSQTAPRSTWSAELAAGYRIDLSALEPTWLSVTADGRQEFNGTLEPEQRKSFAGRDHGRIRTGNAGGISLVFNGKPIGVVGPRGEIRDVVFTRHNYRIVQPPARAGLASFIQTFELMKPLRAFPR